MSLTAIGLMAIAAIGSWLFRQQRRYVLLLISVTALYALQPDGLKAALPTATILLIVVVWWIVTRLPTESDYRLLIVLGVVICVCVVGLSWNPQAPSQVAASVPPIIALTVGTISIGAVIPKHDDE